jgi:hypothetical protein
MTDFSFRPGVTELAAIRVPHFVDRVVTLSTVVDNILQAMAFITEHLDELGDYPTVTIGPFPQAAEGGPQAAVYRTEPSQLLVVVDGQSRTKLDR